MPFGDKAFAEFRFKQSRCIFIMKDLFEEADCFLRIAFVSRCDGILRHGDSGKSFGKDISSFANRNAGCRHLIKHAPIRVEAIFLDEINAILTSLQPFLTFLYMVVSIGQDESETSLKPYRFVRIHQGTVPVEAGEITAVLFVDAVFQPERHDIVHEVVFVCFFPVT